MTYIAITHSYEQGDFARRVFERVQECRRQQDNEQWHLLILEEWVDRQKIHEGFVRHRLVPQVMAFLLYRISWLLYPRGAIGSTPSSRTTRSGNTCDSCRSTPNSSRFRSTGHSETPWRIAVRQIGYDERIHKAESLAKIGVARFA